MFGALEYCTDEGGSGFISDATVPTMSTFDITQRSPVYDQETAWLRNTTRPGAYTFYPDFYPANSPAATRVGCSGLAGPGDYVLTRADVVAPLPSIANAARDLCDEPVDPCTSDLGNFIEEHPWIAAVIVVVGAIALFGGNRK